MSINISILTAIGGAFIVLWALLWTYMRWQMIVHNKEGDATIKKIWWGLLLLGLIFLLTSLIIFQMGH